MSNPRHWLIGAILAGVAALVTNPGLDFGRFRPRMREHSPCGARYGLEFLYGLGVAGT
jgi:hypothetical protein